LNFIKQALLAISLCATLAHAQGLPAGSIGSVQGNTADQFSNYSFNFTAASSGSNYIGFAFRQDPAYWTFSNAGLTAAGSSTNLLVNGNLATGGSVTVTTSSGTQVISAPANWGVWYQNGTYPQAAGSWSAGQWYDGAVGSFDGIYQGVAVTGGVQYTITFRTVSNNVVDNNSVQLGVYAGPCTNLTLAASACVPNTPSFTPMATPSQTVNAGDPSAPPVPVIPTTPTVVSTAAGPSIVTTSTVNGTPTSTSITNTNTVNTTDGNGNQIVTAYYTVTTNTSTPAITSTVTTPVTITTYSDGSTTSTNGTPVTTTTTATTVASTTTQPAVQSVSTTTDVITTNTQASQATVQNSVARGTPNVTIQVTDIRAPQVRTLNINQNITTTVDTPVTTTNVTTTPITTVTTHTPTTTTVDAIGNTVSVTTGTPISTSNTVNQVDTNVALTDSVVVTSHDQTFSTRIDMYTQLGDTNKLVNYALTSDPLARARVDDGRITLRNGKEWEFYLNAAAMQSNTTNTYSSKTTIGGAGIEHVVSPTLLVGVQFNQSNTVMTGDQAGGGLSKNMVGVYAIKTINDWILKGDAGAAFNNYSAYHSLNALNASNSSSTSGQDKWIALRAYTPNLSGFRPFVGARVERNQISGTTETGTLLTSMSYDPTNKNTSTGEAGVAYYKHFANKWSASAEVSRDTLSTKNSSAGISYKTTNTSSVLLKVGTQRLTDSSTSNYAQAFLRIAF
jgi:hypothetical protein